MDSAVDSTGTRLRQQRYRRQVGAGTGEGANAGAIAGAGAGAGASAGADACAQAFNVNNVCVGVSGAWYNVSTCTRVSTIIVPTCDTSLEHDMCVYVRHPTRVPMTIDGQYYAPLLSVHACPFTP